MDDWELWKICDVLSFPLIFEFPNFLKFLLPIRCIYHFAILLSCGPFTVRMRNTSEHVRFCIESVKEIGSHSKLTHALHIREMSQKVIRNESSFSDFHKLLQSSMMGSFLQDKSRVNVNAGIALHLVSPSIWT